MPSKFGGIEPDPPIEVFKVDKAFRDDPVEKKANLSMGAYRTDEGEPWILPVVKKIEVEMTLDPSLNHEYLPILGLESFSTAATRILLGEDSVAIKEGRAVGVQAVAGTCGVRLVAEFLHRVLKYKTFYVSTPTWINHLLVFLAAGFTEKREYRYWNDNTLELDFEGMVEDLKNAPENSVIILQPCAHNPTGIEPTKEQWRKIADVIEKKKLFPFFDIAYQGLASGNLDNDGWAVRYFVNRGFELMVVQSFSKNFGLYNKRVGNVTIVVNDTSVLEPLLTRMTTIIRRMYGCPPNHGAYIVSRVLNDPTLFEEWKDCIKTMSKRIRDMREGLRERLEKLGTPGPWEHITDQRGMFSYIGLTAAQVKYLVKEHHIYMLANGRLNMCGMNTKNIDFIAESLDDAVRNVK